LGVTVTWEHAISSKKILYSNLGESKRGGGKLSRCTSIGPYLVRYCIVSLQPTPSPTIFWPNIYYKHPETSPPHPRAWAN